MNHTCRLWQYLMLAMMTSGFSGMAASYNLQIKDTIGRSWEQEPVNWEIALKPGEFTGGPVLVQRDGKAIPAQAGIVEKYPDGSAKSVIVRLIIDKLDKDAATELTVEFGKEGPPEPAVKIVSGKEDVIFDNGITAVRVLNRNVENASTGEFSPLLAVRLPSGKWTGSGRYDALAKPTATRTEITERGPVRLAARVTTTFDNRRTHEVTVSLWSGSRSIEIDETFDVGPEGKYQFKRYQNDRDELAWEWWSWYGDREGLAETHPNNWTFRLDGDEYRPNEVAYCGQASTDSDKGETNPASNSANVIGYRLAGKKERRLEKYLVGHTQWRPDAVMWYLTSTTADDNAEALALYTHSVRHWRNPNVLPAPKGITLRTGANDMRLVSRNGGRQIDVECPIGLGRRTWALRSSTRKEMLAPTMTSPTALDAERVQRCIGLDITRNWITDWPMDNGYPRLFIKPDEREAYYARLKGKGTDSPGNTLDFFLRHQDQPNFDRDYENISKQADHMIAGYLAHGMDNTVGYPAWMLGYWHGIIVAGGVDNLLGTPFCKPEQAGALKKKLAIITYAVTSADAWADKQINYGWGSMNMPVGRWGGRVIMALALSDHPMAKTWLKDADRYFRMLLETEYAPDGTHISCPHYIGAASTSFYAWIAMANSGLAADRSTAPALRNFARYYMQLMKPVDPRWGLRVLLNEGDTRPGSSPLLAVMARFFKTTDPQLAGELMQLWIQGGSDLGGGMGIPDALIIDPDIPSRKLQLGSQVNRGFGAFLRRRELGTREESYLAFVGGNFMIDHANSDVFGFAWNEKGVPLSDFNGSMYQPFAASAVSHTTLAWDVRPGGAPDPGKGKPGNWYHDHQQPYVDLGGVTPRLHWQIASDKKSQAITGSRGLVTLATDAPEASLLEGKVSVSAMAEYPTRPDNYAVATAPQAQPPSTVLERPFTWTRRLLSVQAPTSAGMNYLVIRDDMSGFDERTPSFNCWWFADSVDPGTNSARFKGQFGVDTDLYAAAPSTVKLFSDTFTHDQCEPIVGARHQAKYGKSFSEKQILCRVEGQRGKGFLVVLFPYQHDEPRPAIEAWLDGRGVKVAWRNQIHYVLLDTAEHDIDADGIKARTSALVVKITDPMNFSVNLPAGGEAEVFSQRLKADPPAGVTVLQGKATPSTSIDMIRANP